MNADEMIARNKKSKHMQELLDAKLPPRDYDTEAEIESLRDFIKGQHELIGFLAGSLVNVTNSVIEMRERQAVQQGAIETLANMIGVEQEGSTGLVGFEKPSLIKPN